MWDNQYDSGSGSVTADVGLGLIPTYDGNILVLGLDNGRIFGDNDALVIKLDQNGNLIWKRVFGGGDGDDDQFHDAIELHGGNVITCGLSTSFGPGGQSGYLAKLDPLGNVIWAKSYGGDQIESFVGCDTTHDNGIVLTGSSQSFSQSADILLCKTDTAGIVQWARTFGSPDKHESGSSIVTLPDLQGYLIAGRSFAKLQPDILVMKTDIEGNLLWARTFGTQGYESIEPFASSALTLTDDGGFIVAGWSDSLIIGNTYYDILIVKSDRSGGALCQDLALIESDVDIITINTNTQSADGGTYSDVTSIVTKASMELRDQCKCISGDACLPCYKTIVHYNLNSCVSVIGEASEMDYSEFVPEYPESLGFVTINAGNVYRDPPAENKHSCTPGIGNSPAMCVSALNSCTYTTTSDQAVVIELNITPVADSALIISFLKFYEKAPTNYNWINGASGPNNYPTRFGIRIWKNDIPIFSETNIHTSVDTWVERVFDFTGLTGFRISGPAIVRIELLGYCLIGNGATVAAWDLDEISIEAECEARVAVNVSGFVRDAGNNGVSGVLMTATSVEDPNFSSAVLTDDDGRYILNHLQPLTSYTIKAFRNDDPLYNVDLFDLIRIQKHLLGLEAFTSPYQKIAADLNGNRSISVMDVVELRKLLLGRSVAFTNNTSWRFGIAGQQLLLDDPWLFDEVLEIHTTDVDIGNAHFRAVKIGDVTGEQQD